VPRAKYTQPPGPLTAIEQIHRSTFRFRGDQWRKLVGLLPRELTRLPVPAGYIRKAAEAPHAPNRTLKTIADAVVYITEAAISSHLTAHRLPSDKMPRKANTRAAIRRLRKALEPFTRGWVDEETADIVPADLDAKLAVRDQEIAKLRLPPLSRRLLQYLCQHISSKVDKIVCAKGAKINNHSLIRYIDFALTCAGIEHPNFPKHRDRLSALIFPQD
jgi:hypothetical protein